MTESPTIPAPTIERSRPLWLVIAVLTAATFWTVTVEMLPAGLLPPMSRDLGVSESTVGALVSAWAITIAILSIPLVRLTLRIPRTALLAVTLAATAPANLLTALAPYFTITLVGRILAATAHGLFWALVISYIATIVDARYLGRTLSIVLAGPTLAGLAALPAAAVIAEHAGWRAVFAGLSLILALTAVALWVVLPKHADTAKAPEPPGAFDRSARGVIFIAAGGGVVLVAHFAAFTYITALTAHAGGLGSGAIPMILLILGATGALGVAVSGFASDRFPRTALTAATVLITLGLALIHFGSEQPTLFVVGAIVWGFAIGAFPPILQARVLRLASPTFRPLVGSIVVTILNLGIAAGAALGGITLDLGPGALTLTVLIAATLGTLLLAAWNPAVRGGASHTAPPASVEPASRQ